MELAPALNTPKLRMILESGVDQQRELDIALLRKLFQYQTVVVADRGKLYAICIEPVPRSCTSCALPYDHESAERTHRSTVSFEPLRVSFD